VTFRVVAPQVSGPPSPSPPDQGVDPAPEPAGYAVRGAARRIKAGRLARGLRVRLTSTGAARGDARLVIGRKTARRLGLGKTRVLARRSIRMGDAGTRTLRLEPTRRVARRLRQMDRRQVTVQLVLRLTDATGNRKTLSRRIVVRR
jgi:hypothetical protein